MKHPTGSDTLYAVAGAEMKRLIQAYLRLVADTGNLANVTSEGLEDADARSLLLAGIGSSCDPATTGPRAAAEEWQRRQAVPFDIETAITTGVYVRLRAKADAMYDSLERATRGFREIDPDFVSSHPQYLPLLQHVGGLFSKAQLKRQIGAVNDSSISGPAAERLVRLMRSRVEPGKIRKGEILKRLDSTLEGIVRDLVGRVLLESVVASALEGERLPFIREDEYSSLTGVVYDFRADFVLPTAEEPRVFIEVRKSSTRHASLYAKDKMFSAINWKGRHRELLGILVVDGPWTGTTLQVMARVFDYVVPLGRAPELAKTVAAYLGGDTSKLKWLIDFRITENK